MAAALCYMTVPQYTSNKQATKKWIQRDDKICVVWFEMFEMKHSPSSVRIKMVWKVVDVGEYFLSAVVRWLMLRCEWLVSIYVLPPCPLCCQDSCHFVVPTAISKLYHYGWKMLCFSFLCKKKTCFIQRQNFNPYKNSTCFYIDSVYFYGRP